MKTKELIHVIETITSPELAEEWDNTGLLIEPVPAKQISTVLLTVDLTEAVAAEAIQRKADFIITYHPLFFGGFNRLEQSNPQARTAMKIIRAGIGVYSPHTALDAVAGGVNDWLAGRLTGVFNDVKIEAVNLARVLKFKTPVPFAMLVETVKQKLKLKTVQTAAPGNKKIRTVALCAGAGMDAICAIPADVFLTGEMKHHDALAVTQSGAGIILCGHTETERGYLPVLAKKLKSLCAGVNFIISTADKPPLQYN
ncbi:MAG: Nif3-like dinuclear metal center hexameric protein [Kiritimatiellales bacterium]